MRHLIIVARLSLALCLAYAAQLCVAACEIAHGVHTPTLHAGTLEALAHAHQPTVRSEHHWEHPHALTTQTLVRLLRTLTLFLPAALPALTAHAAVAVAKASLTYALPACALLEPPVPPPRPS